MAVIVLAVTLTLLASVSSQDPYGCRLPNGQIIPGFEPVTLPAEHLRCGCPDEDPTVAADGSVNYPDAICVPIPGCILPTQQWRAADSPFPYLEPTRVCTCQESAASRDPAGNYAWPDAACRARECRYPDGRVDPGLYPNQEREEPCRRCACNPELSHDPAVSGVDGDIVCQPVCAPGCPECPALPAPDEGLQVYDSPMLVPPEMPAAPAPAPPPPPPPPYK